MKISDDSITSSPGADTWPATSWPPPKRLVNLIWGSPVTINFID